MPLKLGVLRIPIHLCQRFVDRFHLERPKNMEEVARVVLHPTVHRRILLKVDGTGGQLEGDVLDDTSLHVVEQSPPAVGDSRADALIRQVVDQALLFHTPPGEGKEPYCFEPRLPFLRRTLHLSYLGGKSLRV